MLVTRINLLPLTVNSRQTEKRVEEAVYFSNKTDLSPDVYSWNYKVFIWIAYIGILQWSGCRSDFNCMNAYKGWSRNN